MRYLLKESAWADREQRHLNFREFVDHLGEFRRAARDGRLRVSGHPKFGGSATPIDMRHWVGAVIDPETAGKPFGVCTTSPRVRHYHALEFSSLAVRTNDMYATWPRATPLGRAMTRVFLVIKFSLLGQDGSRPSWISALAQWLIRRGLERRHGRA